MNVTAIACDDGRGTSQLSIYAGSAMFNLHGLTPEQLYHIADVAAEQANRQREEERARVIKKLEA